MARLPAVAGEGRKQVNLRNALKNFATSESRKPVTLMGEKGRFNRRRNIPAYLYQNIFNEDMSIIRSTEISLSELVKESNLILQVKFIKLFKEIVPVIDRSKDQTDKPIPPFIKRGCVFQVLDTLKNTARIIVPEKINVPNENWRRSLSQHKEAHAGGKSKSYNVPTYFTDVPSIQKADILFLHQFQGMYDLTARDSFAEVTAKEKIKMLMEA